MIKKVLCSFALIGVTTAYATENNEPEIFLHEEMLPIPTKCYPTSMLKKHFGFSEIVMSSFDDTKEPGVLNDYLLYVPAKNAMFLIRENTEINYTCVITVFDKKDNTVQNKKKKKS